MDTFQKSVYKFIFSLFTSKIIKKKAYKAFKEIAFPFFEELGSSRNYHYHHCYTGGLADHTALVVLDACHSIVSKPWLNIDINDMIVVCMFHDLDKVGYYTGGLKRYSKNDIATVDFLENFGLRNNEIQDGVLLIHGGWSRAKVSEHPQIAVYAHCADMLSSHVAKAQAETRKKIKEIMKEILKIKYRGTTLNSNCLVCNNVLDVSSNLEKIKCDECHTIYYVDDKKIIETVGL